MKHLFTLLFVFVLLPVLTPLQAKFARLSTVPIDRMVEDLKARQQAEPDDDLWVYRLGRVYYLAFEMGVGAAFTYNPEEPEKNFPGEVMLGWEVHRMEQLVSTAEAGVLRGENRLQPAGSWELRVLTEAQRIAYAEKAYAELKRVREMAPRNGLYSLTLASFQRDWLASGLNPTEALREITVASAMDEFVIAWRRTRKADLRRNSQPVEGEKGLFSAEAAKAWLALAEQHQIQDPDTRMQMKKDLTDLSKLRRGAVTPLVFQLKPGDRLPVNTQASVVFDLAGDGRGGRWNWPEEGMAFVIWDPEQRAAPASGRVLFGAYTWQMFWENGFEPLALLDRNDDGRLEGEELRGLSAWFDRVPLGVPSAEEVVPLPQLGVRALQISPQPFSGEHAELWHPRGLQMEDGHVFPIWDWLAQPAGNEPEK